MKSAISLSILLLAAVGGVAQSSSGSVWYFTITLVPTGVQNTGFTDESTIPLPCIAGCSDPISAYAYCFLFPQLGHNETYCNQNLCDPTAYGQLNQCLNCIVANGDERPLGYHTNTSAVQPTGFSYNGTAMNPNGLINATQANGILANVSSYCASAGTTLSGITTTLTATPTTTGPYYTSFSSGETASITQWPNLATYSSLRYKISAPITGTGQSMSSALMSAGTSSGSSGTSAGTSSAASASQSRSAAKQRVSYEISILAGLLALVGASFAFQ